MDNNIDYRKISFNSIDMVIMLIISKNNNKASVGDIRNDLGIAPTNLTMHLKKLDEMNIITVKDFGKGRKKEISLNYADPKGLCLIRGVLEYFMYDAGDKVSDDPELKEGLSKIKQDAINNNAKFLKDMEDASGGKKNE